jgi:type I restriction enzyme M protein
MRRKLVELDLLECVLGLGPNLFYNSPMEACIVVCRAAKPADRRGKVLFINAVNEVTRENAQSFLRPAHQQRIVDTYHAFRSEPGFAAVADNTGILDRDGNLSIPLYVRSARSRTHDVESSLADAWGAFEQDGPAFWKQMTDLTDLLRQVVEDSHRG